jgi:hypothetical protein
MNSQTYVPGVCNIGPAEIVARKRIGWIGFLATVLLWAACIFFGIAAPWRLLLFIPAAMSATGFIQAYAHFCAGFGMKGLFNFGTEVGKTETVQQQEFRKMDRQKALRIIGYSIALGVAIALLAFYL